MHFTAATDRRFHCDIDFGKNLYLYESVAVCMRLFELLCGYCLVLVSDRVSKFVGYIPLHIHTYSQNKHTQKKIRFWKIKKSKKGFYFEQQHL